MTLETVPLASIHPFPEDNFSRPSGEFFRKDSEGKDTKDRATVVAALVPGWMPKFGVAGTYSLEKNQVKRAVEHRRAFREFLRSGTGDFTVTLANSDKVTVGSNDILRYWDDVYVSNGDVHTPDRGLVYGFRRVNSMPWINAIRAKLGQDLITEIPADHKDFESEMDRRIACLAENYSKSDGIFKPSNSDQIIAAKGLYEMGARETELSRAFGLKRGMSQKIHGICRFDAKFPELAAIDEIVAGSIEWGPLSAGDLRKLVNEGTLEEAMAYLADPKDGKGNKSKMASRKDIEALAKQSPVRCVKDVLNAILADDLGALRSYTDNKDRINKAIQDIIG